MNQSYLSAFMAIHELKQKFFSLIKDFLYKENIDDLRPEHALVIYYIGHQCMPMKALSYSGVYDGSNPSYLIHSLIDKGYVTSRPCANDKRIVNITSTEKGKILSDAMHAFFQHITCKDKAPHIHASHYMHKNT